MHRRYYARRRQWRLGIMVVLIFLITVFLVSCMAGSNVLWIKGFFGWDNEDLAAEETVRTLSDKSEIAETLSDTVASVVGKSIYLSPFSTESAAASLYSEALLNTMLLEEYEDYTGNSELISKAEDAYPRTHFVTLIPAADLEARVKSVFGGGTRHRDVGAFDYLDRAKMYTTAGRAAEPSVKVIVDCVEETENSYRMYFCLSDGETRSDTYTAIFQKGKDGACIWKMLKV